LNGVPITDLELGRDLLRMKSQILLDAGHGLNAEDLHIFKANLPPQTVK
jgi:hypothetical protein